LRAGSAACVLCPHYTSDLIGLLRTLARCLPAQERSQQSWWPSPGQPFARYQHWLGLRRRAQLSTCHQGRDSPRACRQLPNRQEGKEQPWPCAGPSVKDTTNQIRDANDKLGTRPPPRGASPADRDDTQKQRPPLLNANFLPTHKIDNTQAVTLVEIS